MPIMAIATFRFHEELNAFLPPERRKRDFVCACTRDASVKHMIEVLGVPHTEVERILVNGLPVGFAHRLQDGDRIEVYPTKAIDMSPPFRLREPPLLPIRFIADAHLGGLARLLRLAGFDTLYDNHFQDDAIVRIAGDEQRIVLSRDLELLKCRDIVHGCYVHALKPTQQLRELVQRLGLAAGVRPFSLCLECNAPLRPIAKAEVLHRLPQGVREAQQRFSTCAVCRRVFWEGTHWRRMSAVLAEVLRQS